MFDQLRSLVLEGDVVRLEPLDLSHAADLADCTSLGHFQHFVTDRLLQESEAGMHEFIGKILAMPNHAPFATCLRATGRAIGSTSFMDIRAPHKGLEIGMTWISHEYQGTKVNPEAKLLLLAHAFEVLGCERVQLKCDSRNMQSQAAILKLGAVFEGRLRRHGVLPDGYVRDTMMYSIIREEWPKVKEGLLARLAS